MADRDPQYLGTYRGISRVQMGWTVLYFNGRDFTHAIGTLFGTRDEPNADDIKAARGVIPVHPTPPKMANAPAEKTSSKAKSGASSPKKSATDAKPAKNAPKKSAKKPKANKPAKSAPKTKSPPPAQQNATAAQSAAKAKTAPISPKKSAKLSTKSKTSTAAPIDSMPKLLGALTEPAAGKAAPPIGSMAQLQVALG